jgi:nicotinic acid phosphoribosyltransferase
VDGFGVGENLVVSADAPVGVGAVAKLTMVRGEPTTKWSRGSGKAHLPGIVQAWRAEDRDRIGLSDEQGVPGAPLLRPVWRDDAALPLPSWAEVREHARGALAALPPERKAPRAVTVTVTDALAAFFEKVVRG